MKKMQVFKLILCLMLLPCLLLPVMATQPDPPAGDPTVIYGAQSPDGQNPVMGSERILQSARSAVLYELTSDTLVYSWNPDMQFQPSSLTKIMTALVAIEHGNLDETVEISWQVMEIVPANAMIAGLLNGEEVTLEQLLYLMMVGSANDAACMIADHIGGSQEHFVEMMNQCARELGCTGTVFRNAHGIHEEGHVSTARDILKILRKAMDYPEFAEIFNTDSYVLAATNLSPERYFETTNYMGSDVLTDAYYDSRVTGGRTGNTEEGRRNLAVAAEENGAVYLTVVLDAESEFADNGVMTRQGAFEDTGLLLDLGFQECDAVQVVYDGQVLEQLPVTGGSSDVVICPAQTVSSVLPRDMDPALISARLNLTTQTLTAPVSEGTYVGEYQVYYGSRCIASVALYTKHDVPTVPVSVLPGDDQQEPDFDPGALTTALAVLGVIFAVIILLFGGLFLIRWFRSVQGKNRKLKRRADRRRSR